MEEDIFFSAETYSIYNPSERFYSSGRNGQIRHISDKLLEPDNNWIIASIQFLACNGRLSKTIQWNTFYNMYKNDKFTHDDLYFKNGRPKTILIDIDHGMPRRWGTRVEF